MSCQHENIQRYYTVNRISESLAAIWLFSMTFFQLLMVCLLQMKRLPKSYRQLSSVCFENRGSAVFVSVTCELLTDILWSGLRLTGTNCDRWTEVAPCRKGTEDLRTQDTVDRFLFKLTFLKMSLLISLIFFFNINATIANCRSICHPPLRQIEMHCTAGIAIQVEN